MSKNSLEIQNLKVSAEDKEILSGINLSLSGGEVHVIMGPNGAGKSTLAAAVMGNPKFAVTQGKVLLNGEDILPLTVDKRAQKGLFLAMQNPAEVPGVTNSNFLKTAVQAVREKKPTITEFLQELDGAVQALKMRPDLPHRYLNDGFSGGEKKRNEMLQLLLLNPKFAILDEIDSGLDMDALKIVGSVLVKAKQSGMGILLITHYERILEVVKPDKVHILNHGVIAATGGLELIEKIEKEGYDFV